MTSSPTKMERIVWNGVGLDVPAGWEPAVVERDGLLLEHEGRAVCELKFRHVRGAFSFDKHIRRLTKSHKGVDIHAVADGETPEAWVRALDSLAQSGMRHRSFMWRTPEDKGIGAALFNPATGLAAMVQYFIHAEEDETPAAASLAAFRDSSGGKTMPFHIFGLTGRVPAGFLLHTFSFKPGHYSISYWRPKSLRHVDRVPAGKGPGVSLVFQRIAPASVVLKERPLAEYVRDMDEGPSESLLLDVAADRVRWNGVTKSSTLRRLLRRETYAMGQVWTDEENNAILAVTAVGTVLFDGGQFNAALESYALVP